MVFDTWFDTKSKLPAESIAIEVGFTPVGVRGRTSVSPPVLLSMVRSEMSFSA
jgi:hypothetical protein